MSHPTNAPGAGHARVSPAYPGMQLMLLGEILAASRESLRAVGEQRSESAAGLDALRRAATAHAEALWARLDQAERARHEEAIALCRQLDARFGELAAELNAGFDKVTGAVRDSEARVLQAIEEQRQRERAADASLPTGEITFLFTDIEGSTELWKQQPQAMRVAQTRHDDLLRQTIAAHGGHVFKTVGDAFCAAFAAGHEALAAAVAGQRALVAEPWDPAAVLRVCMGLHTGGAEQRDGDYFGLTLSHVARLLGAAHVPAAADARRPAAQPARPAHAVRRARHGTDGRVRAVEPP